MTALWRLWLATDNNNGELGNHRGNCPYGGEQRGQDGPDRGDRHRNLNERVAVLVLYNDPLNVALVDQLPDLIDQIAAQDVNFFNNILELHNLDYVVSRSQVPGTRAIPSGTPSRKAPYKR